MSVSLLRAKHFHYQDTLITPGPSQQSGPPIWMASWTPVGLRRAGRLADGWIADPVQSLGVIKDYATRYRAAAEKAGRKPYICLMRDAVLADSMADAEAASEPTMYTHRFYFQYDAYVQDEHIKDVKTPEELSFGIAARERLIVGSPEDCLEQLQMWKEAIQPDYLIHALSTAGRSVAREYATSDTYLWRKSDSEVVKTLTRPSPERRVMRTGTHPGPSTSSGPPLRGGEQIRPEGRGDWPPALRLRSATLRVNGQAAVRPERSPTGAKSKDALGPKPLSCSTRPRRGAAHIPSWEGCRASGGVGLSRPGGLRVW